MYRLMKERLCMLLILLSLSGTYCLCQAEDKAYPTSGYDAKGNKWVYDQETKTLTFSGTKQLEDCTDYGERKSEPAWWDWWDDAEHIVVEEGITGLGGQNFGGFCNVTTVQLPESCTKIGESSFASCVSLETITLPSHLKTIEDGAFDDCKSLKSIDFPKSVTSIGTFVGCESLEKLIIPDKVKKISACAFVECKKLNVLKLPSDLKKLNREMFRNCEKLTSIKLPDSVEIIAENAFRGSCFKTIIISKNVKKIGKDNYKCSPYKGVFMNCHNLKTVIIKSKKLNKVAKSAFGKMPKNVVIKVPKSKFKEYKKLFRKCGLKKTVKIKKL